MARRACWGTPGSVLDCAAHQGGKQYRYQTRTQPESKPTHTYSLASDFLGRLATIRAKPTFKAGSTVQHFNRSTVPINAKSRDTRWRSLSVRCARPWLGGRRGPEGPTADPIVPGPGFLAYCLG